VLPHYEVHEVGLDHRTNYKISIMLGMPRKQHHISASIPNASSSKELRICKKIVQHHPPLIAP
jgi:hypothetical protein